MVIALLTAPHAPAQGRRPVRHPYFGYLVEGHVLRADGAPASGVQIERTETQSFSAESKITDANGAFRFERSGFGWGSGLHWTMILRRAGCPDVTRAVTLRAGPFVGFRGNRATDVVLRLPACSVDRSAAPTR